METEVYLDNSATTRPYKEVAEYMTRVMLEDYGNPSSMHLKGVDAEKRLSEATEIIAGTLKCKKNELIFTSGGTESDNLAILGAARAKHRIGKHIITTKIEHPAVLESCKQLEKEGFEISYLDVDEAGVINLKQLRETLRPDTVLVSVMHTNNEIGSLQPIEEAGEIIKGYNPDCLFHVDAVQGYGKDRIIPKRMNIDLLSVSAHKFHGPRGVGFLYIRDKVRILPVLFGGGQQKGLRSGTVNVPAICGMAKAAELTYNNLDEDREELYRLKEWFVCELAKLEGVRLNGIPCEDGDGAGDDAQKPEKGVRRTAPHIVNASFLGVRSEVLLHGLESKGIYVSSGSACASGSGGISETMKAIGTDKEAAEAAIRFSFSVDTSKKELEYTLEHLRTLLPLLRKYTRH